MHICKFYGMMNEMMVLWVWWGLGVGWVGVCGFVLGWVIGFDFGFWFGVLVVFGGLGDTANISLAITL